jgi:hypothetical protein
MADRPVFLYAAVYDEIADAEELKREIDAAAREDAN